MKLSARSGFTLIELLVVIGILGILAAALVATIDPFEQLRKGEDSRSQNTAVEFHNALIRYYTNHQDMPWEDGACDIGALDVTAGTPIISATAADLESCVSVLIAEGELKEAFNTAVGLDEIFVTEPYAIGAGTAEDSSPSVCYMPVSKSGKSNENARYDLNGAIDSVNCPSQDVADACYWCAE